MADVYVVQIDFVDVLDLYVFDEIESGSSLLTMDIVFFALDTNHL